MTERYRYDSPAPTRRDLPRVDGLLAGAAEVDITPPPGMPKAGHSKNAHDGDGFRTRLRARVIHLRSGTTSVLLIAQDLLAGSALIQRRLAEAVADEVPLRGIFLTATHTHAGPGQYSGSAFYNDWASNRPGFDPRYADFLVEQLTVAAREAIDSRRPARMAVGRTEVRGFTRNRSLGAYVRNRGVADRRVEDQRRYVAIDPDLHLLRVDDADGPMAAFTWFSIHGTGISHHDSSYNADVWSYLNGEVADQVEAATGRRPVSGAAVASHGDMTPAVRPGMLTFPEAERVGRGIGSAAAALHASLGNALSSETALEAGLREIDLTAFPTVDGIQLAPPRIGWAKTAGAAENTTPFIHLVPPFRAGLGRRPRGPHGEKRIIGGLDAAHSRLVAPDERFPSILPVHVLRIGDTAAVGLPFEVTVEAGRRVSAAAAGALGIDDCWVSSLVGDHCDYLTTPEEYTAQFYEGASTLFGAQQQDFVAGVVRRLAVDMTTSAVEDALDRRFDFGVHHYLARATDAAAAGPVCDVARFVEATPREDAHWEMAYTDLPPGDLAWHEPLIRVEVETDDGWKPAAYDGRPVDDQGWHIGIVHQGRLRSGRHAYVVRWFGPPLGLPLRHRFVLLDNAGRPGIAGPAFD